MSTTPAVPTGNTFDKYGSGNRLVKRLMHTFERDLDELVGIAAPTTIVDVGCGEGVLSARWAAQAGTEHVLGLDLADPKLEAQWRQRRAHGLELEAFDGQRIPAADRAFDLAAAIEVLEHVPDPSAMLTEMARVAREHLLVSVPREPLWRALNVLRGAYVTEFGNTPGHVNHFSRRGILRLLRGHGDVLAIRTPFPWTMALVRLRSA